MCIMSDSLRGHVYILTISVKIRAYIPYLIGLLSYGFPIEFGLREQK